ncbi:MAG TPA: aldo/keto reductase [Candidatus Limiplasma sp.]|nr:aldo/keto reductase [Candidatus Limiplasma sp.]HPS80424.1 aldo/keto reductase [Candidatus Limiplasma sp.]
MQTLQMTEGLTLPRVIIGCMRIADSHMEGEALLRFTRQCIELGADTFDHAPVYGGYTCEKYFGDAVLRKEPQLRAKMKLITKAGIVLPNRLGNARIYYEASRQSILRDMDESLERLGTDYVDLLLVHRPDPLTDPAETADALETLVRQGKTLHVGVSNYTPAQTEALQRKLSIPLVTNQLEFSVKAADHFFDGVSDDLFTRGMKPMAWSPLGGGSVFSGTDEQSVRLRAALGEMAAGHAIPVDTLMYAWLFTHPLNILAVTGSMDIRRIQNAVNALQIQLTHEEWYRVLAASRGYDVP